MSQHLVVKLNSEVKLPELEAEVAAFLGALEDRGAEIGDATIFYGSDANKQVLHVLSPGQAAARQAPAEGAPAPRSTKRATPK